ncbi:uncharacterized protein LOC113388534 [Ctenocephalides felis]|uniref:uncharacterized protein LOC113388534 n=1 Tax=Ctenocephalides felis TaxID=7515 RepID=UPI000E6E15DE|nr:uncharacterized protein LOC113388534 [Ctenocephalides felis]
MDILNSIQQLDGKSLGDRYKLINQITKEVSNSTYDNQQKITILNSFQPKDNLEKKLWAKLLTTFEIKDIFLQKLQSEDNELIQLMFKDSKWFFTKHKPTFDKILNQVFPNISTSLRIKFLYLVSEYYDQNELDAFFVILRAQYNLKWAFYILPKCSDDCITKLITEDNVKVTEKFLLKLYYTRPEIVVKFLQYLLQSKTLCNNVNDYKSVIKKLAWNQPDVFFEMYHKSDVLKPDQFGALTTKKLLQTNKQYVLDKPKHYLHILHPRQTHASMKYSEYRQFYLGLCPELEDDFVEDFNNQGDMHKLLILVKKNAAQFLFDVYKTKYKRDVLDNDDMITELLMKSLPVDLKAKCAAAKIDNMTKYEDEWEKWYCYLKPAIAIPKFKEFIYVTNDGGQRLRFIQYMIRCCGQNEDHLALVQVLKYINERHRNEDSKFKNKVLKETCQCFDIQKFQIDVWNCLDEIISVINIGDEWRYMSRGEWAKKVIEERLRYNLKNNLTIDEHIGYLLKYIKATYFYRYNILQDNAEYEKTCLDHIANMLPTIKDFNATSEVQNLIYSIGEFNQKHPKDKMTVIKYQWVVDHIKKLVEDKEEFDIDSIRCGMTDDDEALEYFKNIIPRKVDISIYDLHKYIKKPEDIFECLESIIDKGLERYYISMFITNVKNRKFIYIPEMREKILQACLDKFKNAEKPKIRSNALKVLSLLVDSQTFYELAKPFYPIEKKIDVKTQDEYTYSIQQAIGASLSRYPGPEETFEALRIFSRGDFLKLTLGSLTSVCFKTNQTKALKFLNDNFDQPVSAKKHIIRLINAIGTKKVVLKMLKQLWDSEKHPSIRNVLITSVFNWFASDPDMEIWNLLKSIFLDLTTKDKDIFTMLLSFDQVDKDYLKEHIELCWKTVNNLESQDKINLDDEKSKILQRVTKNINNLDENFINKLLPRCFNTSYSRQVQSSFITLMTVYIVEAKFDLNKKMKQFKDILKQYVDENWWKPNPKNPLEYPSRVMIFDFITTLCQSAVLNKQQSDNLQSFEKGLTEILSIFEPTQIYSNYLELKLTHLYLQSEDANEFIGKIKTNFIDVEIEQYGTDVLSHLTTALSTFLSSHESENSDKYCLQAALKLVEGDPAPYHQLGAIQLLQKSTYDMEVYQDAMNVLIQSTNSAVQIYLNEHLNK